VAHARASMQLWLPCHLRKIKLVFNLYSFIHSFVVMWSTHIQCYLRKTKRLLNSFIHSKLYDQQNSFIHSFIRSDVVNINVCRTYRVVCWRLPRKSSRRATSSGRLRTRRIGSVTSRRAPLCSRTSHSSVLSSRACVDKTNRGTCSWSHCTIS